MAAVLVAAASVSVTLFFGIAWTTVFLIETFEGETSECWSGQCGRFGELVTNHDLLAVTAIAVVAALPAAAVLWKARRVFAAASD